MIKCRIIGPAGKCGLSVGNGGGRQFREIGAYAVYALGEIFVGGVEGEQDAGLRGDGFAGAAGVGAERDDTAGHGLDHGNGHAFALTQREEDVEGVFAVAAQDVRVGRLPGQGDGEVFREGGFGFLFQCSPQGAAAEMRPRDGRVGVFGGVAFQVGEDRPDAFQGDEVGAGGEAQGAVREPVGCGGGRIGRAEVGQGDFFRVSGVGALQVSLSGEADGPDLGEVFQGEGAFGEKDTPRLFEYVVAVRPADDGRAGQGGDGFFGQAQAGGGVVQPIAVKHVRAGEECRVAAQGEPGESYAVGAAQGVAPLAEVSGTAGAERQAPQGGAEQGREKGSYFPADGGVAEEVAQADVGREFASSGCGAGGNDREADVV